MVTAINARSTTSAAAATRSVCKAAPITYDSARARADTPARTGAGRHSAPIRHDARREAATPAAAMLAELIHRMGGANTSAARGAYVNLRI